APTSVPPRTEVGSMKRWLVAVAILLGGAVSFSYADYVLIRAVHGGNRNQDPNQPNPPGGPGVPPPGRPGAPPPRRPGPGGDPSNIPSLGAGQMGDIDTAALAVQAIVPVRHPKPVPGAIGVPVSHKWSAPNKTTKLYNDDRAVITRLLRHPSAKTLYE